MVGAFVGALVAGVGAVILTVIAKLDVSADKQAAIRAKLQELRSG
jgi:hypothetical protein